MEKKHFWRYVFAGAGLIAFYCILTNLGNSMKFVSNVFAIFWPIVLGFMIAFVLNIPMRGLEGLWDKLGAVLSKKVFKKKKTHKILATMKRPCCLFLSIILILLVLSAVVALIIPEITNAIMLIVDETPGYFTKVKNWWISYTEEYPTISEYIAGINIDWNDAIKNIASLIGSGTMDVVGGTLSYVISSINGIVNFVVALIFAVYVLICKETLARQAHKLLKAFLPERPREIFLHVVHTSHRIFRDFVAGQCVEAVILGSLCAIGMAILRFPYAPMVGALVGVTALIPVVGALIGEGVGAFLIMMQSPFQALMFLIFMIVLQTIEGNLIYPKVVGSSVGLPGIWVLAAVMVGGSIGGVAGMLFAVPVAAVLYVLLGEYTNFRIKQKEAKEPANSAPASEKRKKK